MRVFSRAELAEQARLLASDEFCQRAVDVADRLLERLKPRDRISTLDWSLKHRVIRKEDGTRTNWSRSRTPYLVPVMDAHDDPGVLEIIVPKPSRCGGTMVAENFALKCLDYGPSWSVMWYLAGPTEVSSYADRVMTPMFEDHETVAVKVGEGKSDNTKRFKRVGSQTFELMVMSKTTTTNRQAGYIVFDEPDSYHKDYRSNFLAQGRQRQSDLGTNRKIYACAHPDIGWSGGIAAAWIISTQGIFIMRCPQCGTHGSPYPTKYWPDVPRFRLHYEKAPEGTPVDQRLALARHTAGIACPMGCALGEKERAQMADEGAYMHKGQVLDVDVGITGEAEGGETWGFWVHILMSTQVPLSNLAATLEGAIEHKERTGKSDMLKQVLVRTFGEVFEGVGGAEGLDARALKERTKELARGTEEQEPVSYRMGQVPDGVLFLTAAVDVAGNRFDLLVRGWDKERRSWLIDRRVIRQRKDAGGLMRDVAPSKVQDDWLVLEAEIDRLYPLQSDPTQALPIAVMTIDAGDGNVTWKAYEFARRMDHKRWGSWRRVRCIKGAKPKTAPPLPASVGKISKDSEGKPVKPVVTLHMLGVYTLKSDALDDLAIDDGGPGQCYFATNTPDKAFEELFNEPLIDGDFVRNGDNETLDLFGYTEVGRLMLEPDRKDRVWEEPSRRPVWAQLVSLESEGGDPVRPAPAAKKTAKSTKSFFERFDSAANQSEDE